MAWACKFVAVLLLGAVALAPMYAQPRSRPGPAAGAIRPPAGRALERLSRMPPEERKRLLQRLPPERRQRLEQQLERYSSLPPEERERLQEQLARFRNLPPERQQAARDLFRRFLALPDDRRLLVRDEFNHLRNLPPEDRRARLQSDQLRRLFTDKEVGILEDYVALLPQED